jgi:hypothetical protein
MWRSRIACLIAALVPSLGWGAVVVGAADSPPNELWRQGGERGFDGWQLDGVQVVDGRLALNPASSDGSPGLRGSATGPERETTMPFTELIPSWNAETPEGTWIEIRLRARVDGRWTTWYRLGVWSTGSAPGGRHSVGGQDDADARVLTDTLRPRAPGQAYQLAVDLVSSNVDRTPSVSLAAVVASRAPATAPASAGEHRTWGTVLGVPERSQLVYPDGGEVWCSPTSTSMVMAYWAGQLGAPALDHPVPDVAGGTWDPVYRGNGNWPFNTAYAARGGLLGYVSRFSSLDQVERWIDVGVPVVASLAWGPGELANAPVASTGGHLLVIAGFTTQGDVVVNDPAGDPRRGQSVRRTYARDQFQARWQAGSGGAVYLIHPADQAPPPEGSLGAW